MNTLEKLFAVLEELRFRALRIAYVVVPIFFFCLTFRIDYGKSSYLPWGLPCPYPDLFGNVTSQVEGWLRAYELPANVTLINIGIGDAVIAQMEIGLLLAFVVATPWIAHEVGAFLMPALRANERKLLLQVGVPATVLFAVGFTIGLLWITPFTYLLLFKYVAAMGLQPDLTIDAFLGFTLLYSVGFGIVFELPVFVYSLSKVGFVPATFWRKHWRGAVIGCLVFGMLITPDNSGITMLLIATPMVALYFAGMLFAERDAKRRGRASSLRPAAGGAA